jgi:hypothetical protein
MKQRERLRSQIPTIVFSIPASYFALGFFQNFHASLLSFSLLAVSLNVAFRLVFEVIIEHTASKLQESLKEMILSLAVLPFGFGRVE